MANPAPQFQASANIRHSRFVTISGDFTVDETDAGEVAIGITYQDDKWPPLDDLVTTNYHAQTGEHVRMYTIGDICLLTLGGTVTAGQALKSDADGQGVAVAGSGNEEVCAIALEGGASGELRQVQIVRYRQTT